MGESSGADVTDAAILHRSDAVGEGVDAGVVRDDNYRSVRSEGVGAHLLKAFEFEAAKRGATYATLRTGAGERQHAFYLSHGWRDWYPMPALNSADTRTVGPESVARAPRVCASTVTPRVGETLPENLR